MTKKSPKTTPGKVVKKPAPAVSSKDEAWVKSLLMSAERLEELGLITRDDLVISLGRTKRPGQSPPASTKK